MEVCSVKFETNVKIEYVTVNSILSVSSCVNIKIQNLIALYTKLEKLAISYEMNRMWKLLSAHHLFHFFRLCLPKNKNDEMRTPVLQTNYVWLQNERLRGLVK